MKLVIDRIPESGLSIPLEKKEAWVLSMLESAFNLSTQDILSVHGNLNVSCIEKQITAQGSIEFEMNRTCDRCLERITASQKIPFLFYLSPMYASRKEKEAAIASGEDIELTQDDLDFSFYEGPELDVGSMIQQEIVLAQPPIYLCKPDCKGLCQSCGHNLNQGNCSCEQQAPVDPRFAVLKNWGKK